MPMSKTYRSHLWSQSKWYAENGLENVKLGEKAISKEKNCDLALMYLIDAEENNEVSHFAAAELNISDSDRRMGHWYRTFEAANKLRDKVEKRCLRKKPL